MRSVKAPQHLSSQFENDLEDLDEFGKQLEIAQKNRAMTDLMIAARDGEVSTVKKLVRKNAKINAQSERCIWEFGKTALMYAAASGQPEIVKILLDAGANPHTKDKSIGGTGGGKTALHYAAEGGHVGILECLAKAGATVDVVDNGGITALMFAAAGAFPNAVRFLIRQSAEINRCDKRQGTALLKAVLALGDFEKEFVNGKLRSRKATSITDIKRTVQELLNAGADPNVMDKDFGTPLMNAARQGNLQITRMLVEAGADVNLQSRHCYCALARAASLPGRIRVIKYLLEHGADPRLRNSEGMTVIDVAMRSIAKYGSCMKPVFSLLNRN